MQDPADTHSLSHVASTHSDQLPEPMSPQALAVAQVIAEATEAYHRRHTRFLTWFLVLVCLWMILI
jgi:hypothetical protein